MHSWIKVQELPRTQKYQKPNTALQLISWWEWSDFICQANQTS